MIDKFLGMAAIGSTPFWIVKGFELMDHTNRQPAFWVFVIAAVVFITGLVMLNEETK